MFKNAKTTREQGDIGLSFAIFKLSEQGYTVSLPLTDNSLYDLIIEKDRILQTVQVKSTRTTTNKGTYIVQLRRIRSNRTSNTVHKFNGVEYDVLCVVTDINDLYFIPVKYIKNTSTIQLGDKYSKYKL